MFKNFKQNYNKAFIKAKKMNPIKRFAVATLILSVLLSPLGVVAYNKIMDCRESYRMTDNFSESTRQLEISNPELDESVEYREKDGSIFSFSKPALIVSEKAYKMCEYNHQAKAWYYALNITDYDEMVKGFNEINKSRFDKTNPADLSSLGILYSRRISMENDFNTKINLIIEKNNFVDTCTNYLDIIKHSISYKELSTAQEWFEIYETKPNMVNKKYTCSEGDRIFATEKGSFVSYHIEYLSLKTKYHHLNQEPQQRDEYLNKLVELKDNPKIGPIPEVLVNIEEVNKFIEED